MKRFLFLISLVFGLYFLPSFVFAADLNVVCDASSCSTSGADPLFSAPLDGYWYPNRYLTKTINVGNSSPDNQTMSLQAVRSLLSLIAPSPLEDNNIINISLVDPSATLIWSGDLTDFYSAGEIDFGVFAPGTNADYALTVSMNISADDNYQDKEAKLDLTLGFTTDTPPSPPADDGDDSSPSGVSPSVCNDSVPGTPTNLSAESISPTQVLLTWDHVSTPFTSYLVAFGPDIGDYRWGNPNVGSGNSYIVGSLTPEAQYCFYVRAQNGCMPGLPSDPVCINTGSTIPISEIPPPGFQPGVLGEQTEITPTPTLYPELGQAKGTQTCLRYWLPILYILAFFINLLHYYNQIEKSRQEESRFKHFFPVFLPALAYFVDKYLLKNSCCLVHPLYCSYFWIGNILSWLIPLYYYHKQSK